MQCPFCGNEETQVKDSRSCDDDQVIRRRRYCPNCDSRFTTFERIVLREIIVVKKDDSKQDFDKEKLIRSIQTAVRKRPITPEQVESLVNNIVRKLEVKGGAEVESSRLGEMVMDELKELDKVAFIRFASVYHNFDDVDDFERFIRSTLTDSKKKDTVNEKKPKDTLF